MLLLTTGLLVGTMAWVFANPTGAAPDEVAHYVKAVAAGRGDLVGAPGPFPFVGENFTADQRRQVDRSFRAFSVPPRLRYQSTLPCMAFKPEVPADCLRSDRWEGAGEPSLSIVGAYQPFLYMPSGLLTRLSDHRSTAFLLARVGSAALSVSLLGMAAWLLLGHGRDQDQVGRRWRLVGLMLAVTPTVVFLTSAITASGPEVTGAIAVTAGVLRLSRDESRPRPAVWVVLGVAGFLLGLSRPLAPLWLALTGVLMVAMLGFSRTWNVVRDGGRFAVLGIALPAVAAAANLAWGLALGLNPPIMWGQLVAALRTAVGQSGQVTREAIGSFGWVDTPMPRPSYMVWIGLLLALMALAMTAGDRRQRRVLVGSAVACMSTILALGAGLAQHDQAVTGRYVLPVAVALPLLAGEVVARSSKWVAAPRLRHGVLAATISLIAVQVLGWLVNARRYAVGTRGPAQFLTHEVWSPPGGWWPWLLATLAAALLQGCSAVLVHRHERQGGTTGQGWHSLAASDRRGLPLALEHQEC